MLYDYLGTIVVKKVNERARTALNSKGEMNDLWPTIQNEIINFLCSENIVSESEKDQFLGIIMDTT